MPLLEQCSVNELARRRHATRFCVITAKYIPWDPIGAMPDDRKDGRLMLLWEGDRPVIGRWDDGRKGWEARKRAFHSTAVTAAARPS